MRAAWLMTVGLMIAAPAFATGADVKAGVDAWRRGDYKAAVDNWRGPAIAGDADAEFNLGQAYKLGRGVPVDPVLAVSWFCKAALQGHQQAQDNYGLALFQDGKRDEARPWLEKSAARGEPRAELVLGTMLFNGDGVPRDYPRAYAMLTRSSQAGLKPASETLAQMDQYISADDRQRGTALAQQMAAASTASEGVAPNGTVAAADAPMPRKPASSPRPAPAPSPRPTPISRPIVAAATRPAPKPSPEPTPPAKPHVVPARSATASASPPPTAPKPKAVSPAAEAKGNYRVQLGAFRDRGNAAALWSRVGSRVGGHPSYVASGGLTRLQAGPFASRAAAEHACAAAGGGCVVVAP